MVNVAMTLNKLPAIRGNLGRTDPDWERWTFSQFSEAVRQWTKRNPVDSSRPDKKKERHSKVFQAKSRECVYCGDVSHKAVDCTKIASVPERKEILAKKRCASIVRLGPTALQNVRAKRRAKNVESNSTHLSAIQLRLRKNTL